MRSLTGIILGTFLSSVLLGFIFVVQWLGVYIFYGLLGLPKFIVALILVVLFIICQFVFIVAIGTRESRSQKIYNSVFRELTDAVPSNSREFGRSYWSGYKDALTDINKNINKKAGRK